MDAISTISKLLRTAEHPMSNPAEAASAMAAAQKLARKHAVDLAVARHLGQADEQVDVLEARVIEVGEYRAAANGVKLRLFHVLSDANMVTYHYRTNKTSLTALGYSTDIDATVDMWTVLCETMLRQADEYLSGNDWRDGKVVVARWWDVAEHEYKTETKPITKRQARLDFYDGFYMAITSRMWDVEREQRAQMDEVAEGIEGMTGAELSTTALALRERKAQVDEFRDREFRAAGVRSAGGSKVRSTTTGPACEAGRSAGRTASLSNRLTIGA